MTSTPEVTSNPQTAMDTAERRVMSAYGGDSLRLAELTTKLADAQARLHASRQSEVANLLHITENSIFTGDQKNKAAQRVLDLLGIA